MGFSSVDSPSVSDANKSPELSFLGIPNLSFSLSAIPRLQRPHSFLFNEKSGKDEIKN
jgi:hypothetical protein